MQTSLVSFIPEGEKPINQFELDLTYCLIKSNIPIEKLNKTEFKEFLFKYTLNTIPSPNTIRNKYIDLLYDSKIEQYREYIDESSIYLIIDETTDSLNRCVLNILFGILNGFLSQPKLISTTFHDFINSSIIFQEVNKVCQIIWPKGIYFLYTKNIY